MKHTISLSLLLLHLFAFLSIEARQAEWLLYKKDDFLFDFSVDQKTENFYVINADYFSGNPMDQYTYVQGTWDFTTHTRFGDSINSKLTLRNRSKWGNARSLSSTKSHVSILDFDITEHGHGINLLIPWIRKAWVKVSLNKAFNIDTERKHSLKFGAFPYELGRGISLGSAYAASPGLLGFFSDNTIDQYAFGVLLRGDVTAGHNLKYDFYCGVLENLSSSLFANTIEVNKHSVGSPSVYRGFGDFDIVFASRLFATCFDNPTFGKLTLEPYVLYDWDASQKVEYRSDSNAKLGTMGVAVEYTSEKYELGFETAFNFGRQCVKAYDRNRIIPHRNATTAAIEEVYSNVFLGERDATASNKALVTDANKTTVDNGPMGTIFNGQEINASGLYNGPYRFRAPYKNTLAGNMFVIDGTFWFKPHVFNVSLALGYASGGEHPNIVLEDPALTERNEVYGGFVGLQEIYSGSRVRSFFVIGGQGITRPLSTPLLKLARDFQGYAVNATGFSNLIYSGIGCKWTPDNYKRKIMVNPNVLYYWQDYASNKYCLAVQGSETSGPLNEKASRNLGLEANLFFEVNLLENFKGFLATAVFFPGQHFDDVLGKPTNQKQYTEVTRTDRYGIDYNQYPLLNKKTAFALDMGFEYKF